MYNHRGRSGITLALAGTAVGIVVMMLVSTARLSRTPRMAVAPGKRYAPLVSGGFVDKIEKHLSCATLVGTRIVGRETLQDSYFERELAKERSGSYLYTRSDKCLTAEVARATSAEPVQEELTVEPRGLVVAGQLLMPPLTADTPAMWSIPVKAGPPRISGWPLLAEIGLSREETHTLHGNRMIGLEEEAAFNPTAGETLRFYQRASQSISAQGETFDCIEVDYQAFLASPRSSRAVFTHRLDGKLWIARGLGCIKEFREVGLEIIPATAARSADVSYSVRTQMVRTVAERL